MAWDFRIRIRFGPVVKGVCFAAVMVCLVADASVFGVEVIKMGTLATEGSAWAQVFQDMDAELRERSGGQLQFRFYFGRDEDDLVDLVKSRRLDAVSLTSVGLGQILPEFFIFQMPLLFSSYGELDAVQGYLRPRFTRLFEAAGYAFMGWGELGFIYLFSKDPIRTQTDLQKTRFWVRVGDPIARAFAAASGGEAVFLPLERVLPALADGEVRTVYTSPLACIAYQWQTQVRYMTDLRLAAGVGATLVHLGRLNRLTEAHRQLLRTVMSRHHQQLSVRIREQNETAVQVLLKQDVQQVSVPHLEMKKWQQAAEQVQEQFLGRFYKRQLLDDIRSMINRAH